MSDMPGHSKYLQTTGHSWDIQRLTDSPRLHLGFSGSWPPGPLVASSSSSIKLQSSPEFHHPWTMDEKLQCQEPMKFSVHNPQMWNSAGLECNLSRNRWRPPKGQLPEIPDVECFKLFPKISSALVSLVSYLILLLLASKRRSLI